MFYGGQGTINSDCRSTNEPLGKYAVVSVFFAAFVCRLAFGTWIGFSTVSFGDAADYLTSAASFCSAADYPSQGSVPFMRPPGLPFFLAPLSCAGASVVALKLQILVVDSLTAVVIGLLAQVLGGSFLFAGLTAALYPPFLAQSSDIQSEPLFMSLITLSLYSLLSSVRDKRRVSILSPLLLGFASLTRPVALALIPCFAFGNGWLSQVARSRLKVMLMYATLTAIPILPWATHNSLRFGEFILVSDGGGYNFWRGTHPEMLAIRQSGSSAEFAERAAHFETVTSPATADYVRQNADSPLERSRLWSSLAWQAARNDPRVFASAIAHNLSDYWRPWLNPLANSPVKVALSVCCTIPLYILGSIGLWRLRQKEAKLFHFCLLFLILTWLAHAPFQVVMRFRIPLTDPLLIALSTLGLPWLFRAIAARASNRRRSPS